LKRLRQNSQEFESLAERMVLLGILSNMKDDPIFQELLLFFFCKFVNVILDGKLYLTHQGNFSVESKYNIEDDENAKMTPIINILGVLIKLSRNLLEMINYIITKVKNNKDKYRKMLSYLHELKNHNFITIFIDKLTQNHIKKLTKEQNTNPILKYIAQDRIKKSELKILKTTNQELAEGK
jgi:hypothetical protein